ncbi:hypothetical protein [Pseudozobellia thermophila]|uniref:Lipoprotein n=1 Tax=Pseudozobellia thermophila TaxID=192903 RepID=A0A1M6F633_9FLAO|nr:hypothetical protein [Pseudozobellia thermophila]SHI93165.1 hypothetical protein SAMN04488513_102309 [Pseudozobellia thermophila]
MKTYNLFCALLALAIIGCTKSDDGSNPTDNNKGVKASYSLILNNKGTLSGLDLLVQGEELSVSETESSFEVAEEPQLRFQGDGVLGLYYTRGDCRGEITVHDFNEGRAHTYSVFDDLEPCGLTANSILTTATEIYIAYETEVSPKKKKYYVRVLDATSDENGGIDVLLDEKPLQMAFANKRLFVLTLDEDDTGKNGLAVIDSNTKAVIHSEVLSTGARTIFTGGEGNIIVGYDGLHLTIDGTTLAITSTMYQEGSEPNFAQALTKTFDDSGKMYYDMIADNHSVYPVISAVYDFSNNAAVLYAYENFLTETQRKFEYAIESTTMVSFDENNNYILIGYKKTGSSDKGGLLRIKPAPDPKLIDNLDTEGVPYAIFID